MTYIANRIAFVLIKNGVIRKEDEPIYVYGVEVALGQLSWMLTALALGYIFNLLIETIIFIICFCLLRAWAGGYHASSYLRCYLCSSTIVATYLFLVFFISEEIKITGFLSFLAFGDIGLFITAPSPNKANPKTDEEIRINRCRMLKFMAIINGIAIVSIFIFGMQAMAFTIVYALAIVSLLSIINYLQYKEGTK